MVIDSCTIQANSLVIQEVQTAIVRKSIIEKPFTKNRDQFELIEVRHDSKATFEENTIKRSMIRVRHSEAAIRQNKFVQSPKVAIYGEYHAKLIVESNKMDKDRGVCVLKDQSEMHFFNNSITSVTRPEKSKSGQEEDILDRVKAINISGFSQATIEGNIIGGDYDYAIYVDGQSDVDCRANQYQLGRKGGIYYAGVSKGLCEENQYTGQALEGGREEPWFGRGCIRKRKE